MDLLHPKCAGLDVHQQTVVACARVVEGASVTHERRTFGTTTADLSALRDWLTAQGCTHVAMESTGVYWKPIWQASTAVSSSSSPTPGISATFPAARAT
jgi:transposase